MAGTRRQHPFEAIELAGEPSPPPLTDAERAWLAEFRERHRPMAETGGPGDPPPRWPVAAFILVATLSFALACL